MLKVKDVVILTFADFVQRLLVNYIRDVLLHSEAADWFSTWWTGVRGRYIALHMQAMVTTTAIWGLRLIGGTSRG